MKERNEVDGFRINDVVRVLVMPESISRAWDHDIAIIEGFQQITIGGKMVFYADVTLLYPNGEAPAGRCFHGPMGSVRVADIQHDNRPHAVRAVHAYVLERQRQQEAWDARQRAYKERVELVAKKYGISPETARKIHEDMGRL